MSIKVVKWIPIQIHILILLIAINQKPSPYCKIILKKIQDNIKLHHELLPIILTSNDKVFFVDDSLIQGVAPYVKKMLFKTV